MLSALIEHVFVRFDVPRFLLNASHRPEAGVGPWWLAWLVVLGQGGSLRRLGQQAGAGSRHQGLRPIAKRLPGCLAEVPEHLSPAEGVMLAEVIRLGGSMVEHRRLSADRSYRLDPAAWASEDDRRFWEQTVRWLVRSREALSDDECAVVLAWARHRYTERWREPFDWRGRTPRGALRDAREYLSSLYDRASRRLRWTARGWGWQERIGDQEWSVRELTSSDALLEESLAMSHCVRLYDHACYRGVSAIVSLRRGERRSLTVEVRLPSRRIVQARGACNRAASAQEQAVLARWRAAVVVPR